MAKYGELRIRRSLSQVAMETHSSVEMASWGKTRSTTIATLNYPSACRTSKLTGGVFAVRVERLVRHVFWDQRIDRDFTNASVRYSIQKSARRLE